MAESAAAYMNAHPECTMVVLDGSGACHIWCRYSEALGTPNKCDVCNRAQQRNRDRTSDCRLPFAQQEARATSGRVSGSCAGRKRRRVPRPLLARSEAAEKAGLRKGDALVEIDDQKIANIAAVRVALWDRKPGDDVRISVRRKGAISVLDIRLGTSIDPRVSHDDAIIFQEFDGPRDYRRFRCFTATFSTKHDGSSHAPAVTAGWVAASRSCSRDTCPR